MRLRRTPLVALALLAVAACERAGPLEPRTLPTAPTLVDVQQQVFTPSCALSGCHAGGGAPFGLDLSEGQALANLVDVPSGEVPALVRVRPGAPGESYLYLKITGAPGIVGARMPFGRAPLPDDLIALVEEWIEAGAPEE